MKFNEKDRNISETIILAGGGTSGHVNPAIAVADELKKQRPGVRIIFVGMKDGIEQDLVRNAGYEIRTISTYPLFRDEFWTWPYFLYSILKGRRECLDLLKESSASVVVGFGGFVSLPLLMAAKTASVPTLIHEQNAFPGGSNKRMSRHAKTVCIGFDIARSFFQDVPNVIYTGNPVKSEFFEAYDRAALRRKLGLGADGRVLLALGGSMGARSINRAVLDLAAAAQNDPSMQDCEIVLACGKQLYDETKELAAEAGLENSKILRVEAYLYDIVDYMASANLVLTRSGAISSAELAALGKASIMVPYPYATDDHQSYNARAFMETGAGIMICDADLTGEMLVDILKRTDTVENYFADMDIQAKKMACPNAAADICEEVCKLL